MSYERHPLSALFPDLTPEEYADLRESIRKNGIQNDIVVYDAKILDGWHRYQVCLELGIHPPMKTLPTNISPEEYVISQHIARRQLTPRQRAELAIKVYGWSSQRGPKDGITQEELARKAGVSRATIARAVQEFVSPDTNSPDQVPVEYERHRLSMLFPDLKPEQFAELVEDIRKHGVLVPILVTNGNQIVDGWQRYRACQVLGIEPPVKHVPPEVDLVALAESYNLRRCNIRALAPQELPHDSFSLTPEQEQAKREFLEVFPPPPRLSDEEMQDRCEQNGWDLERITRVRRALEDGYGYELREGLLNEEDLKDGSAFSRHRAEQTHREEHG